MKNSIFNTPYLIKGKSNGYERFSDVALIGPQGLYFKDGSLVETVLDECIYWLPNTLSSKWLVDRRFDNRIVAERLNSFELYARNIYRFSRKNNLIKKLSPEFTYVDLSHPFGWYAFGHLHDSLQRLFNLHNFQNENSKKIKYIVSRYDRVNDFLDHLSVFVGGAVVEDDLVVLDDNIYLVDDLVKPYMPSVYTNFRDDVFDWMLDRYKNYFCINDGPRTKLYLTRNHIKPGSRGVLNENDFINKLKEAGFLVVRGDESLEDIYKLFSAAALIVGPHGSLFANTIFSSESCRIYEFCPNNRVDTSFFRKNKKSHHYEHLLQDADDKFNITIPSQFIDFIINENV